MNFYKKDHKGSQTRRFAIYLEMVFVHRNFLRSYQPGEFFFINMPFEVRSNFERQCVRFLYKGVWDRGRLNRLKRTPDYSFVDDGVNVKVWLPKQWRRISFVDTNRVILPKINFHFVNPLGIIPEGVEVPKIDFYEQDCN